MKMWLTQSTPVIFAVAVAVMVISAQGPVILNEEQKTANVSVGSTLVLQCRLRIQNNDRFRVSWYFNQFTLFNNSQDLKNKNTTYNTASTSNSCKMTNQDSGGEGQEINETFSLSNVSYENSGWYFCKVTVEIPVYICYNSNGTYVNVTANNIRENTTYLSVVTLIPADLPNDHSLPLKSWMWIIVGASAFTLIVLLVICNLLRRRCLKSRAEPDAIYMNTRPIVNKQPSPRPWVPADNLKAAPASQNLQTPSPGRRYEESKHRRR